MPSSVQDQVFLKIGPVLLGILLALILGLSRYLFPVDDDFCFFSDVRHYESASEYLAFWYQNWAGRWLATLLRYFYYAESSLTTPIWLGPLLLSSAIGGAFLISTAIYGVKAFSSGIGFFIAVVFLLLMSQPRYQLFWAPAGFDYTVGYVVLGAFLASCRGAITGAGGVQGYAFLSGALLFGILATGFSELQALIPPAVAFGLLLLAKDNRLRWGFLTISCSVAASLNLLAPGAQVRKAELGLTVGAGDVLRDMALYGSRFFIITYLPLMLITLIPMFREKVIDLGEMANEALTSRGCWLIVTLVVLFPVFTFGLISWAQGAVATGRTTNLALLLCLATWPIIFFKAKEVIKRTFPINRLLRNSLGILGIVSVLAVNLPYYLRDLTLGRAEAALKNFYQNDSSIKDSELGQAVIWEPLNEPPKSIPTNLVSEDNKYWVNRCIARAYSVKTVQIIDPMKD